MKLFIKLALGLIAVLILAVIILVTAINPNDYKAQIQSQVKKSLNRELLINGDIGWTIYPQLGFSCGEIELNNLKGFNRKQLVKIDNAAIALQLLPLFKGEIKIGELTLNGLVLNLITNKDGTSNLDNMFPDKTAADTKNRAQQENQNAETESQKSGFFTLNEAQLAGINITNALIEVQDLQAGSANKINISYLHLGKFALGKETDLSLLTEFSAQKSAAQIDLQAKLIVAADFSSIQFNKLDVQTILTGKDIPNGKIASSLQSNVFYNIRTAKADLNELVLMVDQIQLTGVLSVQTQDKTKVRFTLQGNEWDLNPYLLKDTTPLKQKDTNAKNAQNSQADIAAEQEPDLKFLNSLDIKGTVAIAGLKASGVTLGKIDSVIEVSDGKAQLMPLTIQLYQGVLTLNGWVDGAKGLNKYHLTSALKAVQIRPFLSDTSQIDFLSGTTALNFSASGSGLTVSKIKSGLVGDGDFELVNGALYGINIPQEIRTFKAKLTGKATPTEKNVKKTDFASLTGKFSIQQGVVDNNKLLMLSPVMRLDGMGLVDILQESLNYKLSVTPLSKSTADTELSDLGGITIPLLIIGPFSAPKFTLDMEGALKEELKIKAQQLESRAKEELKKQQETLQEKSQEELKQEGKKLENKMKKELGKFFG